jgi:glutamyl-tRNA synthetase
MGIVPEAFRNFLALLGWSPQNLAPGSDGKAREMFSTAELIELFSLDGISKSPAVFGNDKLAWFNTEYIRAYSTEKLLGLIRAEWARAGLTVDKPQAELESLVELLKPRARSLLDFATTFRAYFSDAFEFDTAAVTKFLSSGETRTQLAELATRYEADAEFSEASTEQVLRDFAEAKGVKAGVFINGARVALTGQGIAPSLFAVMVALGKERVVRRLAAAPRIAIPTPQVGEPVAS